MAGVATAVGVDAAGFAVGLGDGAVGLGAVGAGVGSAWGTAVIVSVVGAAVDGTVVIVNSVVGDVVAGTTVGSGELATSAFVVQLTQNTAAAIISKHPVGLIGRMPDRRGGILILST